MNILKVTLCTFCMTLLWSSQLFAQDYTSQSSFGSANLKKTATEEQPVLKMPSFSAGKVSFAWSTQTEEALRQFELRIYENNPTAKSSRPLFAEIIKGNEYQADYRKIGLSNHQVYYYTVRPIEALAAISPDSDKGFSEPIRFELNEYPVCTDPQFFKVAQKTTSSSIELKWVGTLDDIDYNISYRVAGSNATYTQKIVSKSVNTLQTNIIIAGLTANTEYEFKIKSKCGSGGSIAYSNEVSAFFKTQACTDLLGNITKGTVTSNSIAISWTNTNGSFDAFEIGYGKCDETKTYVIVPKSASNNMSYNLTGLLSNTNYCIVVKGMCGCSTNSANCTNSSYTVSNEKSATIQTQNPCNIPQFWISNTTPCKIDLLWYDSGDYKIEYKAASASTWTSITVNSTASPYAITNVLPEIYSIRMRKVCVINGQSALSAYTAIQTANIPQACPKPYVTLSNETPTKIKISYYLDSNTPPLTVCYKKANETNWTKKENCAPNSYIENLISGETYSFRIYKPYCFIADCNDNPACSELANSVLTIDSYTTPCAIPQSITVDNILSTSVTFTIQNYPNNFSFDLRYRVKNTPTWTTFNAVSNLMTITNLIPNTEYEFEFKHPCANTQSDFWYPLSVKTALNDNCVNPAKTDVIVKEVTTNAIILEWQKFNYNNNFELRYQESGATTWSFLPPIVPSASTVVANLGNLVSGRKYNIEIRRKVGLNFCDWLILDPITTFEADCKGIEKTKVIFKPNETSIEVTWEEGLNPAKYEIRYRKKGTSTWATVVLDDKLTFTATNLIANTEYEFELKRICKYGDASWFAIGTAKTAIGNLPEPKCDPAAKPVVSTFTATKTTLSLNEIVFMYGVPIKVTKLLNTTGQVFSGEGEAALPFGKSAITFVFSGLKIDDTNIATAGIMEGKKDKPENYPDLLPTVVNINSFTCTNPKPKPDFDKNGLYQPGNKPTDPNGFDSKGGYKGSYPCFSDSDKIDDKLDPRGFNSKGIHFQTQTAYDQNGCDINGIKADKKTLCTCYKPCDPCNPDSPYAWLNGGSAATVAGNNFANAKKSVLPDLIDAELAKITQSATTELTIRKEDCDKNIRPLMDKHIGTLKIENEYVYGQTNQYYAERMSEKFTIEPKVLAVNSTQNTRSQDITDLETEHVKLYKCDIKVVAYTNYNDILLKLKSDPAKYTLLSNTIFEKIRKLDTKTIQDFEANPALFSQWINTEIEIYAKLEYKQIYGKDIVEVPLMIKKQRRNIDHHTDYPAIGNEKTRALSYGIASNSNDFSIINQAQQVTLRDMAFDYEQGFSTVGGIERAFFLEALVNERTKSEFFSQLNPSLMPIELTKKIGNIEYNIYIDNLKITTTGGSLEAYLVMNIPSKTTGKVEKVILKGSNIKFGAGGITSDPNNNPRLYLLSDIGLSLNNVARFVLKGANQKTFAEWDCQGFSKLSVEADVQFCRQYLTPLDNTMKPIADPNKLVTANFVTVISDWDDFEVNLNISNFAITKYPNYKFKVKNVILDNAYTLPHNNLVKFPTNYTSTYVDKGVAKPEWKGFFLGQLDVTLPPQFKTKVTGQLSAFVENMIIDDEGMTGVIGIKTGKPLLSLDEGDMDGWAYSIDKFEVKVFKHEIAGGGFGGLINIPVFSGKSKTTKTAKITPDDCFNYTAVVSPGTGEYIITVETGTEKTFNLDMLKAQVILSDDSYIKVSVVNEKFVAEANINGDVVFTGNYEPNKKMNALPLTSFSGLKVSNTKPYFSPGKWELPKSIGLNYKGFGVTFSGMDLIEDTESGKAYMDIKVLVKLTAPKTDPNAPDPNTTPTTANSDPNSKEEKSKDKFKLDAQGGFRISGKMETDELGRQRWVYEDFSVNSVYVDGSFPGVKKINGYITFFDEFTTGLDKAKNFGEGFQGGLDVDFDKLGVQIKAVALFGKTKNLQTQDEYKYFMVDAMGYFENLNVNVGGLDLKGFGGGVYHHMKRDTTKFLALTLTKEIPIPTTIGTSLTGIEYLPSDDIFAGVRGMVAMALPKAEKAFNCNLLFGIEFNKNMGISEIMLLGNATFFDKIKVDKIPKFVAFGKDPESGLNLSIRASIAISARFGPVDELNANMMLFANLGGVIKGGGDNDMVGAAILHIKGKDDWYLNIGTPVQKERVSLAFAIKGVKSIPAKISAYLCIGTSIPPMPDLPSNIQAATGLTNFMANESTRKGGKGFAFGANLSLDIGEKEFLIFYGSFKADIGFDVMLKDYGNISCTNTGKTIGINGWYASGQFYAGIQAEIGVKARIWGVDIKAPIMKMSAAAVLQAKLPNPFWAKGVVGGYYSVLGGALKGQCKFEITFGESCAIKTDGGANPDPNLNQKLISSISPENDESGVPVSANIPVEFNFPLNKSFTDNDVEGKAHTYVLGYEYANLKRNENKLTGTIDISTDGLTLTFKPTDFMPSRRILSFEIKVMLYKDGVIVKEEIKTINFRTDNALKIIPADNVVAAYPTSGQYNFYRKEYKAEEGYILLNRSQEELLSNQAAEYKAFLKDRDGDCFATKVKYEVSNTNDKIKFELPSENLLPGQIYSLQLAMHIPVSDNSQNNVNLEPNNGNKLTIKEGCPANIGDWKVLYQSYFRTSYYDNFLDKFNAAFGEFEIVKNNSDQHILSIDKGTDAEPFDRLELSGDGTSKPFAELNFKMKDTKWYSNSILPTLYTTFPTIINSIEVKLAENNAGSDSNIEIRQINGDLLTISKDNFSSTNIIDNGTIKQQLSISAIAAAFADFIAVNAGLNEVKYEYDLECKDTKDPTKCRSNFKNSLSPGAQAVYSDAKDFPSYNKENLPIHIRYTLPGLKINTTDNKIEFKTK
jgi:hypothetical protein